MRGLRRFAATGALCALWILGGCGGEREAEPAKPGPAPAEKSSPAPAPAAAVPESELRHTPPDPAAVGVEGELGDDVPVPASAEPIHPPLIASGTTRASYESSEPLSALHSFYKAELSAKGWELGDERALEGQVLLSARKGGREISVAISETDGRSQFVILIVGE